MPGRPGSPIVGDLGMGGQDTLHECPRINARSRMDDETGRLVDNDHIVVHVHRIENDRRIRLQDRCATDPGTRRT